jgi:hypothetical protein
VGDWATFNGTAWQRVEGGAAGNFTDLTASGAVTLSGGTANGVAYLNGSKVLTSGSALTFDGTTLSAARYISTSSSASLPAYAVEAGSGIFNAGASTIGFSAGSSELMRLTSTGLGIGTSSPSEKLHVSGGNARIDRVSNTTVLTLGGSPSANWEGDIQFLTSNSVTNWRLASNRTTAGAFTITPSTAGGGSTFTTPAVTVNSSGNLGIGTSSPANRLVVQQAQNTGDGIRLLASGSDTTLLTRYLSSIDAWQITSSYGTTGAYKPIAWFTSDLERMRLDASGNLGIGTSSPGAKLEVSGNSGLGSGTGSPIAIRIGDTSQDGGASTWNTTTDFTQLQFYSADASTPGGANIRYTVGAVMENTAGQTTALTFRSSSGGTLTERMRIDSNGNVGIGTSSPAASAILDAQSTTKGVRMPNMTTTQKNAIASPAAGLMVYDTTLAKLCVYTTAWETITSV